MRSQVSGGARSPCLVALVLLVALLGSAAPALAVCDPPEAPGLLDPPASAQLEGETAYVAVEVLPGETFEVWLTLEGQSAADVTSSFSLREVTPDPDCKNVMHANLAVPLGDHSFYVVQEITGSSPEQSPARSFSRVAGATVELGAIDDASGTLDGQRVKGAYDPSSGTAWLLAGETMLSGAGTLPAAQASSSDTDASNGIDLTWYGEPGTVAQVLGLVSGTSADEEEVWLTAPFERGSDVLAYYTRIDTDATPPRQGIGIAEADSGALPFQRLEFPTAQPGGGGHFDDDYSLFQGGDFPEVRGTVIQGSDLYLFGRQEGASGLPEDGEIVLARVPLADVEDHTAYEYWTEVSGVRDWRSSPTGIVPLFTNASAPTVAWNTSLGRWLAVHSLSKGTLTPYAAEGTDSAIQLRVADDLRGPWSPAATAGVRPVATSGGVGSALDAIHLPAFDSGSLVYVVATDESDPSAGPVGHLYEIDLDATTLSDAPIAPQLTTASAATSDNPETVDGYASPGDTVTLWVNGAPQESTTAAADGSFTLPAILLDGANAVHAVAESGGLQGPPSDSITLTYTNSLSRALTNPVISADTVWTEGSNPVYVITGNLTVNAGVQFVLQPGVEVRFGSTRSLLVDGELRIQGTAADPVVLTASAGSPTPGSWYGVDVRATGATAVIDHAVIRWARSGIEVLGEDATVRDTQILDFQLEGIWVSQSGTATVERTAVDRTSQSVAGTCFRLGGTGDVTIADSVGRGCLTGLDIQQSAAVVTGSLFELNTRGAWIKFDAYPTLSPGNVFRDNSLYGVWLDGLFQASRDPIPDLRGNDFYDNGTDVHAQDYADPLPLLDASGSWWGTTDPAQIAAGIRDGSDAASAPFVAFAPFLDDEVALGGVPVPGNYLNGPTTGVLFPGAPYEVVGKVLVPDGASLTILSGAELRFLPGLGIEAEGLLDVAGNALAPVHLHSASASPQTGEWDGILLSGPGAAGSVVEGALVEHGYRAVEIVDTWATVRDSTFREFGRTGSGQAGAGVWIDGESSEPTDPKTLVRANLFEHTLGHTGSNNTYGIYVQDASPTVQGNEIRDADDGVRIAGSAGFGSTAIAPALQDNLIEDNLTYGVYILNHADPVLTGNAITGNGLYGVAIQGLNDASRDPRPVANENEIHGNGPSYDVSATSFGSAATTALDFERNWWGTTDLAAVAARIYDQADYVTAPVVRFAPVLDGPGGDPVAGTFLAGPFAPDTTLSGAASYTVTGDASVLSGETLVIEAGATLSFLPGTTLRVEGTIDVQGAAGSLATFTSAATSPASGDWEGIFVASGATGTIAYAAVEYAERGIEIQADGFVVTDCEVSGIPVSGMGVRIFGASGGTLARCTIDNGGVNAGIGLELYNSPSWAVEENVIEGAKTGISLTASSPTLTGNVVQDHLNTGIHVQRSSDPWITDGNLIAGNTFYGVQIQGNNIEAQNPAPVIQGNEISGNGTYDLWANFFGNAAAYTVDATLNYWGTTDPGTIAGAIYDRTETTSAPTVDFDPFLDASMNPVSGSYLNGALASNTTLAASTTWDVVGDVTVPTGVTLTVADGVTLRFAPNTGLLVEGTLDVNGTVSDPAVFTSASASPSQATWDGISITAGTSEIDHARIEYAHRGVDARGATVHVRDSEILEFGRQYGTGEGAGLYYEDAGGTILDNLIERTLGWVVVTHGVYLRDAEPTVDGNTLAGADNGLTIEGPASGSASAPDVTGNLIEDNLTRGIWVKANAAPTIDGGNVVTGNEVGIYVQGDPLNSARDSEPVVNGNDLGGNVQYGYLATSFGDPDGPVLDAEGNWWGMIDTQQISLRIHDANDSGSTGRSVDFAPYLDASVGSGGTPISGSYHVGALSGSNVFGAGTHEITGPLLVPVGSSLTIQAGAELEFVAGAELRVAGTLTIAGTSGNLAVLTSISPTPAAGDWRGVFLESTSTGSGITWARIEYAERGVDIDGVTASVTNSEILAFSLWGIRMADGAAGTISGNTIANGSDLGWGLYLDDASPTVSGNTIEENDYGILLRGGSSPLIQTGNTITANRTGIRLEGGRTLSSNPDPTIRGNSIYGNDAGGGLQNLYAVDYFYPGISMVLDARENWWGVTSAGDIRNGYWVEDPPLSIDFSDPLDGVSGTPITGAHYTNVFSNVRHDAITVRPAYDETLSVQLDMLASGQVELTIYAEDDDLETSPIYQETTTLGAGAKTLTWDGKDSLGGYVGDGAYRYVLREIGSNSGNYDPPRPPLPPEGTVTVGPAPSQFNAYRNEPWTRQVSVEGRTRRMALRVTPEGRTPFLAFDRVAIMCGTGGSSLEHTVSWDGFDPDGLPVEGLVYFDLMNLSPNLMPNHVVLAEVAPAITGPSSAPAPTIQVRSNPALVYHSYDQLSEIRYEIDQTATVQVKLLPPGVSDPNDPAAILLQAPQLQSAGEYAVTWRGHDGIDTNAIAVSEEGAYTFAILATSQKTSVTATRRGALQLRR